MPTKKNNSEEPVGDYLKLQREIRNKISRQAQGSVLKALEILREQAARARSRRPKAKTNCEKGAGLTGTIPFATIPYFI